MFRILRQLSVPKLSELILRWTFYYSKFFGVTHFRLKRTTAGRLQVEESSIRWKWLSVIHRSGHLITFSFMYIKWMRESNDSIEIFLHFFRFTLNICGWLSVLRLQLSHGQESNQLINRCLQLFQRVQDMCHQRNPKRMGFGGKQELVLLFLMVLGFLHDKIFLIAMFKVEPNKRYLCGLISDFYIYIGYQLLMHVGSVWYLSLGVQFSDLNYYVRTHLRVQLEALGAQPTRKGLSNARKRLDKCLTLYQDLLSLTLRFQRIFNLTLFLSLTQNCISIAVFTYKIVVQLHLNMSWTWSKAFVKIFNMVLLCLSVQRALFQFGAIRRLTFENCYLSDIKDWHKTLDVFFSNLSLYELQVCPLGLFKVSNELILVFFSALINYFTVVIQYGLQQRNVLSSLEQLKSANA